MSLLDLISRGNCIVDEFYYLTPFLVGVTGFEPATSPSRTVRATELRHTPILSDCNKKGLQYG